MSSTGIRLASEIAISSPEEGAVFIATQNKIEVEYGVTDNLDPAPEFEGFLVQIEDKGSPRGDRPETIAISSGEVVLISRPT